MVAIAFSMFSGPETRVTDPVWFMRMGEEKPLPTNSSDIEIGFLSLIHSELVDLVLV
jgi:hypothetical protein